MIRRNVITRIHAALADTPVVMLNGARQTGKTTLVRMHANNTHAAYFTLDDAMTLASISSDPAGFIRALEGPSVIDEVQKAPDLFPAIKLSVDEDRRPGRFLLTGSANIMTVPRLSGSLVGRMEIIALFPFSAGEMAGVHEVFVSRLFNGAIADARAEAADEDIPARLVRGGYPEASQRQADERRSMWFASYISTLLQRDVRDLARVDALHTLPNLVRILAARTSGLLNLADVGRDAGLPHSTLTRYMSLLEATFIVHRLPAWSSNIGKRLVKAPKLHVLDSGLACHLVGADAKRLRDDRPLLGRMLETFVVSELRKQVSWTDPGITLNYFRTAKESEVDVILEKRDGTIAAVEVKAGATVDAADFAALRFLRDQFGARFRGGVVLYLGEKTLPFGDKLWLAPVSALWAP